MNPNQNEDPMGALIDMLLNCGRPRMSPNAVVNVIIASFAALPEENEIQPRLWYRMLDGECPAHMINRVLETLVSSTDERFTRNDATGGYSLNPLNRKLGAVSFAFTPVELVTIKTPRDAEDLGIFWHGNKGTVVKREGVEWPVEGKLAGRETGESPMEFGRRWAAEHADELIGGTFQVADMMATQMPGVFAQGIDEYREEVRRERELIVERE